MPIYPDIYAQSGIPFGTLGDRSRSINCWPSNQRWTTVAHHTARGRVISGLKNLPDKFRAGAADVICFAGIGKRMSSRDAGGRSRSITVADGTNVGLPSHVRGDGPGNSGPKNIPDKFRAGVAECHLLRHLRLSGSSVFRFPILYARGVALCSRRRRGAKKVALNALVNIDEVPQGVVTGAMK